MDAVTRHAGESSDLATIFSDAEMSKLWNRLKRQRSHQPDMAQSWKDTEKLPKGQIRVAKRELLWLWVGEGMKITKRLVNESCALVKKEEAGEKMKWLTPGRLKVLVGDEEADLCMKECAKKPNPARPGHYLYLYGEEFYKNSTAMENKQEVKGSSEMDDESYKNSKNEFTLKMEQHAQQKRGSDSLAIEDKQQSAASDIATQVSKRSRASSKPSSSRASSKPSPAQLMVNKLWSLSGKADKLVVEVEAVGQKCCMSELEAARGEKLKESASSILELQVHLKQVIRSFDPTLAAQATSDMEKLLKDAQTMLKTAKSLVAS